MTTRPAVDLRGGQIRRNRRIALTAVFVLMLLLVGYWLIGWPKIGPSTVTNKSRALSLDVPTAWVATTPWNSPRTVWPLVGGPSREPWPSFGLPERIPDIVMVGGAPSAQTRITLYMDLADDDTAEMHERELSADLKQNGFVVAPPVEGSRGSRATRSRQSQPIHEVVTIRSLHYVVTAVVSAPDEAALRVANNALATLTIRDDR